MEEGAYGLCGILSGHTAAVRCLLILDGETVATGSLDNTIIVWKRTSSFYEPLATLVGHTGTVSSLAYCPVAKHIISGSFDKSVRKWDAVTHQEYMALVGHTAEVSCVSALPDGRLLSGSWDQSIRLWDGEGSCCKTYKGHEQGIIAMAVVSSSRFVSGDGKGTAKVWHIEQDKPLFSIELQSLAIRVLRSLGGGRIMSVGNEGYITFWSLTKEDRLEPAGAVVKAHTEFIYGAAVSERNVMVSGGEEKIAKVWAQRGGEYQCCQEIYHPGVVWAIDFFPAGHIVTACGDGNARVFATSQEKWIMSPQTYQESVMAELMATKKKSEGPPIQDVADLLTSQGGKDGDVAIGRHEDGSLMAYGWNAGAGKWHMIGEYMGQKGDGDAVGVQKEDVFPISLDDGRKFTLRFPHGENPYTVAQNFIWEHGLGQSFLDQLAGHIYQNSSDPSLVESSVEMSEGRDLRAEARRTGVSEQPANHSPGRDKQRGITFPDASDRLCDVLKQKNGTVGPALTDNELSLVSLFVRSAAGGQGVPDATVDAVMGIYGEKLSHWVLQPPVVDLLRLLLLDPAHVATLMVDSGFLPLLKNHLSLAEPIPIRILLLRALANSLSSLDRAGGVPSDFITQLTGFWDGFRAVLLEPNVDDRVREAGTAVLYNIVWSTHSIRHARGEAQEEFWLSYTDVLVHLVDSSVFALHGPSVQNLLLACREVLDGKALYPKGFLLGSKTLKDTLTSVALHGVFPAQTNALAKSVVDKLQ